MKYFRNSDLRFHLMETRAWWFIWLAVLGFLGLAGFVVWKQEYFRPFIRVHLVAAGSHGVQKGMAVRLSGFRIGKVHDVELAQPGEVRVRVDVFREYSRFVRRDSVAAVASEGWLGDRFIEIRGGSTVAPEAGVEDVLRLEPEKSLGTMVESLRDDIRPAVADAREMISYLNDPEGDLKVTMRQVRALSTSLNEDLPAILAQTRRATEQGADLMEELNRPEGEWRVALSGLGHFVRTMNDEMPRLVGELRQGAATFGEAAAGARQLMTDADRVVHKVDAMVQQSAPEVPKLVRSGATTMKKADEVVTAVRGLWPLRRAVPKEEEKLLRAEEP